MATIAAVDIGLVPGAPEQRPAVTGEGRVAGETDPAAEVPLTEDDEVGAREALVERHGAPGSCQPSTQAPGALHLGTGDHVSDETGPEDQAAGSAPPEALAGDHVSDETGPEDPDAVDSAELDLVEEDLAGVEMALERLADGSYGTCEVCSRQIADDQLLRDPTARRCAEHLPLPAG